jgi:hypothetical protein
MRAEGGPEKSAGDAPKLSVGQRALLRLPRVKRSDEAKEPISDWARRSFMKPEDPSAKPKAPEVPEDLDELEDLVKRADDKERAFGLIAAPAAAAIAFVVIHVLNEQPKYSKPGVLNSQYISQSTLADLFIVLIVLAFGILIFSLLRKRLFMGVAAGLYGLAIFNMHYWGFGVPFVFVGAWYLVRAYRLQRSLRQANGEPMNYAERAAARKNEARSAPRTPAPRPYTPTRASASNRALKGRAANHKR